MTVLYDILCDVIYMVSNELRAGFDVRGLFGYGALHRYGIAVRAIY